MLYSMADKQRSIFDDVLISKACPEPVINLETKIEAVPCWTVFIDGASRGNPGNAGAGVYIKKADEVIVKTGFFLGTKTNNEAEYIALLVAIFFLKKHVLADEPIIIHSDSLLIIQQMKGVFKVKKHEMRTLHTMAMQESFGLRISYEHVMRERNQIADALANEGVDNKTPLPLKFLDILQTYEIFI